MENNRQFDGSKGMNGGGGKKNETDKFSMAEM